MASPLKNLKFKIQSLKSQSKIKNFKFRFVIFIFTFFILNFNCYAQSSRYIRVAVIQDAPSLNLKIEGSYEIINSTTGKIVSLSAELKTTVTTYENKILLGRLNPNLSRFLIKIDKSGRIIINGRRFRGNIELIKKVNAELLVVNHIDLEDYVKGILYNEASHYWPMEALEAQSIACRTYALYQCEVNRPKDYDATPDTYSQVYGGSASERYRTNKAVNETKGIILTYQAQVFPAYYHATCAGHTEDASLLWGIDILPLKGVTCNFCKDSPHFNWHSVLSLDSIGEKLNQAGYKISKITTISVLGKDTSNRLTDLEFISAKKNLKIAAKDFRNIIGPNIIRSANFRVSIEGNDCVFEGFGWGHGVGLCQWGAYFMAKQGYTAEEILKYYYPGVTLTLNP